MIIAIDGPAGVGKSTISKKISKKLGFFYLNSGNFYRAVTLGVFENSANPEKNSELIAIAKNSTFEIKNNRLFLNGNDVEDSLHTDKIDKWVAQISAIIELREIINSNLKRISARMDIVAEGRDMTTVVFPEADLKIYLDASVEVRAKRRFNQGVSLLSLNEIISNIRERDGIDRNKPAGKLKIAEDALFLDTSDLTIEQVCEKVLVRFQMILDNNRE